MARLVTDLAGNILPAHQTITVDHVESKFVVSVVGMQEITEKDIRDAIQAKFKVASIHTDQVLIRGKLAGSGW